jgi:gliding motility-associated-like protein
MKRNLILFVFIVTSFTCNAYSQTYTIVADTAKGCDSLQVQFSSNAPTGSTSSWDFGNGATSYKTTPDVVKYDTAGVYTVTLSVKVGTITYKSTFTINIHKSPSPYFTFTEDASNALARDFSSPVLNNTYTYQYSWSFGDGGTDTVSSPMHTYADTGIYPVKYIIVDNYGCTSTLTQNVDIFELFEVPNVFTPNNDGVNDLFTVYSAVGSTISLKIYNRNGLLLYQNSAEKVTWDGTVYGEKLNNGIYYYLIEASKGSNGSLLKQKKKGFFYLFRE